jgi:hypothetical protein
MATIFLNQPGRAVALSDEGDSGLPLRVDGIQGSWFGGFKSILTEAGVSLDGNYQFAHTLNETVYAYVFGDRISQLRLSGLAFASGCDGGGQSGIELIMQWYEANKISARERPIQAQIGTSSAGRLRGYLTHMRADVIRPEARISQFALIMHVFPASGGSG